MKPTQTKCTFPSHDTGRTSPPPPPTRSSAASPAGLDGVDPPASRCVRRLHPRLGRARPLFLRPRRSTPPPPAQPPPQTPRAVSPPSPGVVPLSRCVRRLHPRLGRARLSSYALAVSSGFKRDAMPIKNHDVQSLIRWIHVPCPGGFQTGARGELSLIAAASADGAGEGDATHKGIATWDCAHTR